MKKTYLLFALGILIIAISCKKDEKDSFDVKYTSESVEASKANVEDNAIALLDEINDLTNVTAIEILMNLNELNGTTPLKSTSTSNIMLPVLLMKSFKKESIASDASGLLKTTAKAYAEPFSITEEWEAITGTYTYNSGTGDFDKSSLSNKVVILFPGKASDNTNTAEITIDNFKVFEVTDPISGWPEEDMAAELPSSINVSLKYKGTEVAGFAFSGSYKSDGMPTKVTSTLTVDEFSFILEVTHSPYSEASFRETFKRANKTLLEIYLKANGDWSEDNIDANIEEEFEEIIRSANAHFILMNIKIVGKVNIKALADKMKLLEDDYYDGILTESKFVDAQVAAINANTQLIVVYVDKNTKIAQAEAYKYYDSYYDEYYPNMRFVYNDGSKIDMETYLSTELNNFYDELDAFIDELNEKYKLGLEPVDM